MAAFRDARRRLSGRWIRGLALLLVWAVVGAVGFALLISLAWGQATPTPGAVTVNLVLLLLLLMVRPACVVGAWGSILALSDASPAPRLRELPRAVVIPVEAPPEVPLRADDFPRPSGPADPAPGE
jgi:hypothetical protein